MTQTGSVSVKVWVAPAFGYCNNFCNIKKSNLGALTVGRVVNGGDDARGQDNLLPGLANVQDVDTVGPGLPQVGLHVHLQVLGTEVALGSEEHLNVLLGGVEDRGEVGGGHLVGLGARGSCLSGGEDGAVAIMFGGEYFARVVRAARRGFLRTAEFAGDFCCR